MLLVVAVVVVVVVVAVVVVVGGRPAVRMVRRGAALALDFNALMGSATGIEVVEAEAEAEEVEALVGSLVVVPKA